MTKASKQLSRAEIIHLSKLANIKLTEIEIEKFQKQLSSVVGYVEKLKEVNTDNVVTVSQVTGLANVTAEDGMKNTRQLSQEKTLQNAQAKKNGFIRVNAIFKE